MIVVDTSALACLYVAEVEAPRFRKAIGAAELVVLPTSCIVEFALLRGLPGDRRGWLSRLIERFDIRLASIDRAVAETAAEAADIYGRGTGHPARLNFGDCLSYAVARHLDAPLLYKGGDFVLTDIRSVLAP